MKRIMLSFAFLLAIGAAYFSQAADKLLVTNYYEANPGNKAATCRPINCEENTTQPVCNLVSVGFSTYKSIDAQPACNTLISLRRKPM